jgi:hypothetical protein
MPRKTNGPMEGLPQADRSSRRDLLKRALVLLGAGVLIQPNGGVSGSAFAQDAGSGVRGMPKKHPKKKNPHPQVPPPQK